jgi:hypothetical protein
VTAVDSEAKLENNEQASVADNNATLVSIESNDGMI